MENTTQENTLTNPETTQPSNQTDQKPKKPSKPFRRKAFIDPICPRYKFNRFKTYEENKDDYYKTLALVFSGKCKDFEEAYNLTQNQPK